jgi:hypothetical protein
MCILKVPVFGFKIFVGQRRHLFKILFCIVQTCPLDPAQETEQDRKLNLILSKVRTHVRTFSNT